MRKSSRGNPYHDERGRFCSGPRGNAKYTISEKTPEEYDEQTEKRFAMVTNEETGVEESQGTQLVTGIMWDVDEDADGNPLPTTVEVPAGMDEDEISDYLSDKYGYCHEGFSLESDNSTAGKWYDGYDGSSEYGKYWDGREDFDTKEEFEEWVEARRSISDFFKD